MEIRDQFLTTAHSFLLSKDIPATISMLCFGAFHYGWLDVCAEKYCITYWKTSFFPSVFKTFNFSFKRKLLKAPSMHRRHSQLNQRPGREFMVNQAPYFSTYYTLYVEQHIFFSTCGKKLFWWMYCSGSLVKDYRKNNKKCGRLGACCCMSKTFLWHSPCVFVYGKVCMHGTNMSFLSHAPPLPSPPMWHLPREFSYTYT